MIEIVVGTNIKESAEEEGWMVSGKLAGSQATFSIPQIVLEDMSSYFEDLIKSPCDVRNSQTANKSKPNTIELLDVDPYMFGFLTQYMYFGEILNRRFPDIKAGGWDWGRPTDTMMEHSIKLWILAEQLEVPLLMDYATWLILRIHDLDEGKIIFKRWWKSAIGACHHGDRRLWTLFVHLFAWDGPLWQELDDYNRKLFDKERAPVNTTDNVHRFCDLHLANNDCSSHCAQWLLSSNVDGIWAEIVARFTREVKLLLPLVDFFARDLFEEYWDYSPTMDVSHYYEIEQDESFSTHEEDQRPVIYLTHAEYDSAPTDIELSCWQFENYVIKIVVDKYTLSRIRGAELLFRPESSEAPWADELFEVSANPELAKHQQILLNDPKFTKTAEPGFTEPFRLSEDVDIAEWELRMLMEPEWANEQGWPSLDLEKVQPLIEDGTYVPTNELDVGFCGPMTKKQAMWLDRIQWDEDFAECEMERVKDFIELGVPYPGLKEEKKRLKAELMELACINYWDDTPRRNIAEGKNAFGHKPEDILKMRAKSARKKEMMSKRMKNKNEIKKLETLVRIGKALPDSDEGRDLAKNIRELLWRRDWEDEKNKDENDGGSGLWCRKWVAIEDLKPHPDPRPSDPSGMAKWNKRHAQKGADLGRGRGRGGKTGGRGGRGGGKTPAKEAPPPVKNPWGTTTAVTLSGKGKGRATSPPSSRSSPGIKPAEDDGYQDTDTHEYSTWQPPHPETPLKKKKNERGERMVVTPPLPLSNLEKKGTVCPVGRFLPDVGPRGSSASARPSRGGARCNGKDSGRDRNSDRDYRAKRDPPLRDPFAEEPPSKAPTATGSAASARPGATSSIDRLATSLSRPAASSPCGRPSALLPGRPAVSSHTQPVATSAPAPAPAPPAPETSPPSWAARATVSEGERRWREAASENPAIPSSFGRPSALDSAIRAAIPSLVTSSTSAPAAPTSIPGPPLPSPWGPQGLQTPKGEPELEKGTEKSKKDENERKQAAAGAFAAIAPRMKAKGLPSHPRRLSSTSDTSVNSYNEPVGTDRPMATTPTLTKTTPAPIGTGGPSPKTPTPTSSTPAIIGTGRTTAKTPTPTASVQAPIGTGISMPTTPSPKPSTPAPAPSPSSPPVSAAVAPCAKTPIAPWAKTPPPIPPVQITSGNRSRGVGLPEAETFAPSSDLAAVIAEDSITARIRARGPRPGMGSIRGRERPTQASHFASAEELGAVFAEDEMPARGRGRGRGGSIGASGPRLRRRDVLRAKAKAERDGQ